jgi:hypothetical protein
MTHRVELFRGGITTTEVIAQRELQRFVHVSVAIGRQKVPINAAFLVSI